MARPMVEIGTGEGAGCRKISASVRGVTLSPLDRPLMFVQNACETMQSSPL
jgi:hypothetical protein